MALCFGIIDLMVLLKLIGFQSKFCIPFSMPTVFGTSEEYHFYFGPETLAILPVQL
ncbi:MAG: hypothetical protein ACLUIS_06805 [Longibaculum sp.]